MAAGLQLFDDTGTLSLDATFSIPKFIGTIMTNGPGSGRVYIPLWETQQPWFVAMTNGIKTPNAAQPTVYADGAYLVWDRRYFGVQMPIIYGHR